MFIKSSLNCCIPKHLLISSENIKIKLGSDTHKIVLYRQYLFTGRFVKMNAAEVIKQMYKDTNRDEMI